MLHKVGKATGSVPLFQAATEVYGVYSKLRPTLPSSVCCILDITTLEQCFTKCCFVQRDQLSSVQSASC